MILPFTSDSLGSPIPAPYPTYTAFLDEVRVLRARRGLTTRLTEAQMVEAARYYGQGWSAREYVEVFHAEPDEEEVTGP